MKDFLLIANKNCIAYKEFFPLTKDRKVNIGYTHPGDFDQPEEDTYKSMQGLTRWFTTLSTASKPPLVLTATYSPEKYKRYDNYDAINVDRVKDIPYDYDGVIGCPITILDHNLDNVEIVDARDYTNIVLLKNKGTQLVKDADGKVDGRTVYPRVLIKKNFEINPEQFEILGATQRGCHNELPDTRKYDNYREITQEGTFTGSGGGKTNENANVVGKPNKGNYFIDNNGRTIYSLYQRIFIRRKK